MHATSESIQTLPESAVSPKGGKYLTFQIGPGIYGIKVEKVREIMRMQPITPIPQMPQYIKGVLNLRGKIIPVVDLRTKFGVAAVRDDEHTCIIVVQVALEGKGSVFMGLIVDAVEEVFQIQPGDIEQTPDFGTQVDADYILGMAKIKGSVKMLIDIDKVIAGTGLEGILKTTEPIKTI